MSVERSSLPHDTESVTEETATAPQQASTPSGRLLSADTWAVLLALAVAALVKLHVLNTVAW